MDHEFYKSFILQWTGSVRSISLCLVVRMSMILVVVFCGAVVVLVQSQGTQKNVYLFIKFTLKFDDVTL